MENFEEGIMRWVGGLFQKEWYEKVFLEWQLHRGEMK